MTRAIASLPRAYICLIVSAEAMPEGKGSLSTMSICRRRPMPTTMPTSETASVHAARRDQPSCSPVRMVSAGIGATRPAELMLAPADAAVWLMLFSSIP